MRKHYKLPLIIFGGAVISRLVGLGNLPSGLSLSEVNFGLYLSNFLGNWVLSPLFVRLPFFLLGIITLYLFYLVLKSLVDENFSLIATGLLSITPWHFSQSRVFSPGMIVFAIFLLAFMIAIKKGIKREKLFYFSVIVSFLIFSAGILNVQENLRSTVDRQRRTLVNSNLSIPVSVFSNKYIESYRFREKLIFENLDFGNYFFRGHPRERWAVEETKKFYIAFIPLLLIGLFNIKKREAFVLGGWTLLSLTLISFTGTRGPSYSLPLIFPFIYVISLGAVNLYKRKGRLGSLFFYSLLLLLLFEATLYGVEYKNGLSEGKFSPRRPIYKDVVEKVAKAKPTEEKVLVTTRLDNIENYFKFYLKDKNPVDYEFREFVVWDEQNNDKLFVDVLPNEPSPVEPLYNEDGGWPEEISVIEEYYDERKEVTIVVYRI